MLFGKRFKEQRTIEGYSQKALAEKLHIGQTNISNWELDKCRPEYEHLIDLARLYKITLEELLGVEDLLPR